MLKPQQVVEELLKAKSSYCNKELSFSSVESFTGGAFSAKVIKTPGSSQYFKGALVTYSPESKKCFSIDISQGIVTKKVTKQMALKGKEVFKTDICFSFNGNAGPTSQGIKDVGFIYIGINEFVFDFQLQMSREKIIDFATDWAMEIMDLLRKKVI